MTAINHEETATFNGLSFSQYHEREMARMTALLVSAAGGKIRVTKEHMANAVKQQLVQSHDHATGDVIFTTDLDIKAFDASFGEAK